MKWYSLGSSMSRREAKLTLKCMQEIIDNYGFVTLADFYDLIYRNPVYTDNKKGWRSLAGAKVSMFRKHKNYRLKLPNLEDLE